MTTVTKLFEFEACHHLPHYDGACHNLHGHSYKLEVTVSGQVSKNEKDPKCGMIIDFKDLKANVGHLIIDDLDHYNLNDKLWFNTTAENMAVYFYELLSKYFITLSEKEGRYIALTEVKLWETPTSFASYKGVTKDVKNTRDI